MLPFPFVTPDDFEPCTGNTSNVPTRGEWFILRDRELLVSEADGRGMPSVNPGLCLGALKHFGHLRDVPTIAAAASAGTQAPEGYAWVNLRALYGKLDDERLSVAGLAALLLEREIDQAFCGRCGATTVPSGSGGRECPMCHLTLFARIEPAVIVAVRKPPNYILLARGSRLPPGLYSVLAGFLEPGESLEQCAAREVFEETGIRIKNLRYMGSQPWPFPRSLMVGFLAEYESGDICVDADELESADWFALDALPPVPPRISIARWLIDQAVAESNYGAIG